LAWGRLWGANVSNKVKEFAWRLDKNFLPHAKDIKELVGAAFVGRALNQLGMLFRKVLLQKKSGNVLILQ